MPADPSEPLWVVSAYFNPTRSTNRLANFRTFRRHLRAPLLVVELAAPGMQELRPCDAEMLVSMTGEPFLWQKERLINLAIARLPSHVRFVAWVDCDLIFQRPDWPQLARAELERDAGLVQLFREAVHLPQQAEPFPKFADLARISPLMREPSLGNFARVGRGAAALRECYDPASRRAHGRTAATGMAVAARRDSLADGGLYDGAIIGGGDAILMCAALDLLGEEFINRQVNAFEFECIRDWAMRAKQAGLLSPLRDIDQCVYHLWHGAFEDRQYGRRHRVTAELEFDPRRHITLASNGTWQWAKGQDALAQGVRDYFLARLEG